MHQAEFKPLDLLPSAETQTRLSAHLTHMNQRQKELQRLKNKEFEHATS
jgi:hypothetical protein